jgi:hypothetical protein
MLAGVLNVSPSWLLHGVGTSPAEDTRSDMVRSLETQLERLKRLQEETTEVISQIEGDLQRYAVDR